MANAARVHLAEHGKDPRRYTLLATGGAGPVHAYYVAKKLGLTRLIAPHAAGVASALGLLIAPARADRVATVRASLDEIDLARSRGDLSRLEADARAVLAATLSRIAVGDDRPARRYPLRRPGLRAGRCRSPPVPTRSASRGRSAAGVREELPRRLHAHAADDAGRDHQRAGQRQRRRWRSRAASQGRVASGSRGQSRARGPSTFPKFRDFQTTPVYDRYALVAGQTFDGPAIVEEREVDPGDRPRGPLRGSSPAATSSSRWAGRGDHAAE